MSADITPTILNNDNLASSSVTAAKKYSDVMIAHAVFDENKKAKGGQAGDQTTKEVCVRTWYVSGDGWTHILRPCNDEMAEKIAQTGENAAANDHIGYDQENRNQIYTYSKPYNFDVSKITTDCNCDCSSLASIACLFAGCKEGLFYKSSNLRSTSSLRSACEKTGQFTVLTDSKYLTEKNYLKRGDIILREPGHVAICLQNGSKATTTVPKGEEKTNNNNTYYTVTGAAVNVRSGPGKEYEDIGTVHEGDLLEVVTITNNWAQLATGGYVSAKYLEKV